MKRHHALVRRPGARVTVAILSVLFCLVFTTAADWPMYLHDQQHTANQGETFLSTANAGQLVNLWTYKTGGPIAAQATVVGNVVYVGSWDGYEYAIDATKGTVIWKTFLGITNVPGCSPPTAGVTSTATVQNGVVYVGGGDSYWYALDAATGNVLWKIFTGDNSASGGYYNWSSPLINNGFAYVGIASFGDCPLVPGQLLKVNLTTHQVVATFTAAAPNHVGGGIWTTPAIDTATNTIFVTTGTKDYGLPYTPQAQPYVEAMVALDASTLAVKSSWQIPASLDAVTPNADWGTSPTLFSDNAGHQLVVAQNADGFAYAFKRRNVGAGPVWQQQVSTGGACPQCGDGSVSSGAFGQGTLYLAGGNTTINGVQYNGAVRAMDPAKGAFLWQHGTTGVVIAALAYINGVILAGNGNQLEALDATTGKTLFSYLTAGTIYGAPSVSNGRIFFGDTSGNLYALGMFTSTTPTFIDTTSSVNNVGTTSDSNMAPGNFDGYGGSYSAQALQAAGISPGQQFSANGVPFKWPNVSPGSNDNIVAQGQTITLPTPANGVQLGLVGASNSNSLTGSITVTYSDGTVNSYQIGFSDWTLNGGQSSPLAGDSIAATLPYHNCTCGRSSTPTYLFSTSIPLQAARSLASITLPPTSTAGGLHIFSMTVAVGNGVTANSSTSTPTSTPVPGATSTNTPMPPTATSTNTPAPGATSTSTPVPPTATATGTPGSGGTGAAFDLSAAFNNVGITDDSNPGPGNFDGGGASYSAQALQAVGFAAGQPVAVNGVTFRWPSPAAGTNDDVAVAGQTVSLGTPAGGSTLAFLGAAAKNANTGAGTITYSDGSTQGFQLGFSDWTLNGGQSAMMAGDSVAATTPYRNHASGSSETVKTYVFYTAVALQAGKAVKSVTLPPTDSFGPLHVFAMTVK